MKTKADKTNSAGQTRTFASRQSKPQNTLGTTSGFVDNRPQAIAQRKLQQAINNRPRMVAQRVQLEGMSGVAVQQQGVLDEEEMQMKAAPGLLQRRGVLDEEEVQMKAEPAGNRTGMPDNLKAGIENLSGMDMSDVRVHYNSPKPAQLNALAYTQGTNIHVAPRQERHLPHEAWHAVQQKQGRVRPTMQVKGTDINDDKGLEKEADVMGAKARRIKQ